jgi:hypothetical protein
MTRRLSCKDAAVLTGCLLVISGCTGGAVQRAVHKDVAIRSGPVRLTSFHGCGEELNASGFEAKRLRVGSVSGCAV